jgi:hypothetical protein
LSTELEPVNPIKDKSEPRSIINITPGNFSRAVELIPDEFFELSERELRHNGDCGEIEEKVRIAFWREYDQAQVAKRNIHVTNVHKGTCSQQHFYRKVLTNPYKMAYVLTPPQEYALELEEMIAVGFRNLREIMALPLYTSKGFVDARVAEVKLKIFESVMNRAKGALVYKTESKNLNVNVDASSGVPTGADGKVITPEELDKKLNEIRALVGEQINVQAQEIGSSESEGNQIKDVGAKP